MEKGTKNLHAPFSFPYDIQWWMGVGSVSGTYSFSESMEYMDVSMVNGESIDICSGLWLVNIVQYVIAGRSLTYLGYASIHRMIGLFSQS